MTPMRARQPIGGRFLLITAALPFQYYQVPPPCGGGPSSLTVAPPGEAQPRMSAASPTVFEPARQTKVYGEFDVVVFGGGPAGIAAAIAAGRFGRSTILVERYGFLGGAGPAAGPGNSCGVH